MPAYQQQDGATIQNCSCVWCSDVQRTQVPNRPPTEYPVEQQAGPFGVSSLYDDDATPMLIISLYLNQDQDVDNRIETGTIVPDRTWAPVIPPQTAVRANIFPRACPRVLIPEVLA